MHKHDAHEAQPANDAETTRRTTAKLQPTCQPNNNQTQVHKKYPTNKQQGTGKNRTSKQQENNKYLHNKYLTRKKEGQNKKTEQVNKK